MDSDVHKILVSSTLYQRKNRCNRMVLPKLSINDASHPKKHENERKFSSALSLNLTQIFSTIFELSQHKINLKMKTNMFTMAREQ